MQGGHGGASASKQAYALTRVHALVNVHAHWCVWAGVSRFTHARTDARIHTQMHKKHETKIRATWSKTGTNAKIQKKRTYREDQKGEPPERQHKQKETQKKARTNKEHTTADQHTHNQTNKQKQKSRKAEKKEKQKNRKTEKKTNRKPDRHTTTEDPR